MKWLGWMAIPFIIFVALVVLWVMRPIFLSSFLTSRLGVRVEVGSIDLGTARTTIGDFRIKNPFGYKTTNAFKAQKTIIEYQWKRLTGKVSEIDLIEIDDVFLSVEFDSPVSKRNNWTKILEKLPKQTHQQKELIIHKLVLNRLTVEIRGIGVSGTQTKTVDNIELDEIDSKEGFPTSALIQQIFGGAGLEDYLQGIINPANTIRKLFTPPFGSKE